MSSTRTANPSAVLLSAETGLAALVIALLFQRQAMAPGLAVSIVAVPLIATTTVSLLPWKRSDFALLPIAIALNVLGLIILSIIAPKFAPLQATWSLLGLGIYFLMALFAGEPRHLRHAYLPLFLSALFLTLLTFLIGTNPSGEGSRQWLAVGPYYFQPSEVLKLSLAILLAVELNRKAPKPAQRALPILAVGASLAVLVLQSDLGAAFMIAGVGSIMLYAKSGNRHRLILAAVLVVVAVGMAYAAVPYARARLNGWIAPWRDPLGGSYQVTQSLKAISSGGITGKGLLVKESVYVPASHTDIIIAPIAERLGLAGSLATIAFYALLLMMVRRTGEQSGSELRSLLALGVATLLVGQFILIIGGSTGLLPLTGITVPLVSYGGSSLIASYLALGLLDALPHATVYDLEEKLVAARAKQQHALLYRALAGGLFILALWMTMWHLAGEAILTRVLP